MRIGREKAIERIGRGEVVALPTETVYGLAASIAHPEAIERIFLLKGRPKKNPLIIHAANLEQIASYVLEWPPRAKELARAFWPGPLTLVLPVHTELVPSPIRAGLPTAAFRVPAPVEARSLLEKSGPLVMPSANLSGSPSATQAVHVEDDFGASFPVWDCGACTKGVESTILYYLSPQWVVLRKGALPPEKIAEHLGYIPLYHHHSDQQPLSPGQLYRHYAPKATLLLEKDPPDLACFEAILGFRDRSYPPEKKLFPLGSLHDPEEVAANLYTTLRALDEGKIRSVWVDSNFPKEGLWETIHERLHRASLQNDSPGKERS